jgi:hypothetical protein
MDFLNSLFQDLFLLMNGFCQDSDFISYHLVDLTMASLDSFFEFLLPSLFPRIFFAFQFLSYALSISFHFLGFLHMNPSQIGKNLNISDKILEEDGKEDKYYKKSQK